MMRKLLLAVCAFLLPWGVQAHGSKGYDKYQNCKPFNKKVRIEGKRQRLRGLTCRQYNGEWEFVSYDEFRNRFKNRDKHQHHDNEFVMNDRVFAAPFGVGFGIRSSNHSYGYNGHSFGSYGNNGYYGNRKWRGRDYLNSVRKHKKKRWKKRGGNSVSFLIRNKDVDKK